MHIQTHVFLYKCYICSFVASLMAQLVKNLAAVQETQSIWVQSLGRENPLEEEMATHCSSLAGEIPGTRGAWRVAVRGVTKSRTRLSD